MARDSDLPARLGGDEFAVLVHGATPEGMDALADRVLAAVRASDEALGLDGFVLRVSVGWALDEPDSDTLLAAADAALLRAKRSGKDRAYQYADRRQVEPVRRRRVGRPRRAGGRSSSDAKSSRRPCGDLEHRADQHAVHVAHEASASIRNSSTSPRLLPATRERISRVKRRW